MAASDLESLIQHRPGGGEMHWRHDRLGRYSLPTEQRGSVGVQDLELLKADAMRSAGAAVANRDGHAVRAARALLDQALVMRQPQRPLGGHRVLERLLGGEFRG